MVHLVKHIQWQEELEMKMQDDYRNFLFESYVKMVSHFQPKAFVFENVEGILLQNQAVRLL